MCQPGSERGWTRTANVAGEGHFNGWMERMPGETRTVPFAYEAGSGEQIVTVAH